MLNQWGYFDHRNFSGQSSPTRVTAFVNEANFGKSIVALISIMVLKYPEIAFEIEMLWDVSLSQNPGEYISLEKDTNKKRFFCGQSSPTLPYVSYIYIHIYIY